MPQHDQTEKISQTIRGMKLELKITHPAAILNKLQPLIDKFKAVYAWAEKDPDQLGLFEEDKE